MTRPARTLLEVCVARAAAGDETMLGQLRAAPKGMRVCQYVVEWVIALGDDVEPEVRAVAGYWREPEATAYRRNRDFRELFPEYANPEPIARAVAAGRRKGESPAALMQRTVAV